MDHPATHDEDDKSSTEVPIKAQWISEQHRIAKSIRLCDDEAPFLFPVENREFCETASSFDPQWHLPSQQAVSSKPPLSLIGGVDISFVNGTNVAVSSIAVFSFPDLVLQTTLMMHCEMTIPYMPTFLAFREIPAIDILLDKLAQDKPELFPQLLFVDGNGFHHPRHCGVACHLGVKRGIPTIGVAKDFLSVGGLSRDGVEEALFSSGSRVLPLTSPHCPLWGYAALTGNSTRKPIYISPGHMISFGSALALTMMVCKVRIPEPIRQADLLSRAYIRDHFSTEAAIPSTEGSSKTAVE